MMPTELPKRKMSDFSKAWNRKHRDQGWTQPDDVWKKMLRSLNLFHVIKDAMEMKASDIHGALGKETNSIP